MNTPNKISRITQQHLHHSQERTKQHKSEIIESPGKLITLFSRSLFKNPNFGKIQKTKNRILNLKILRIQAPQDPPLQNSKFQIPNLPNYQIPLSQFLKLTYLTLSHVFHSFLYRPSNITLDPHPEFLKLTLWSSSSSSSLNHSRITRWYILPLAKDLFSITQDWVYHLLPLNTLSPLVPLPPRNSKFNFRLNS